MGITRNSGSRMASKNERVNVIMQILVSLIVLMYGILVLTAPNVVFPEATTDQAQKFAAGWVGMVIGYWLS